MKVLALIALNTSSWMASNIIESDLPPSHLVGQSQKRFGNEFDILSKLCQVGSIGSFGELNSSFIVYDSIAISEIIPPIRRKGKLMMKVSI